MESRFAKFISYVFHPLFLPFYAILVMLYADAFQLTPIPQKGKLMLAALVFLTIVLLPLFLITIYHKMGWLSDYHMRERTERRLPLITMGFAYLVMAIMLQRLQIASLFYLFLLTVAVLTIALLIINNYWKISLHTSAMGGLLGAFCSLALTLRIYLVGYIILLVLLAGLVGYARLKLKTHNASQVYVGYIVGFTTIFLFFLFI